VWAFLIIMFKVLVEIFLHLLNGLVEFLPVHYPEMLIQEGPVETFDKTVALGPSDFGDTMFDIFQLQGQFIWLSVCSPTEFYIHEKGR
jgi:hypothetical protein